MEVGNNRRTTTLQEGDRVNHTSENECGEVPGTFACAQRNWNKHANQKECCPGNGECVSRHKNSSSARLDSAEVFRSDAAAALRHIGHQQNETRKRVEMIGSTGQGLGHLADAHAIGRSPVSAMEHRFPKTIA